MKTYTVVMRSTDYEDEVFPNLSLKESMLTIKRLLLACEVLDDEVSRIIGIELRPLVHLLTDDDPIPEFYSGHIRRTSDEL